MGLVAMGECTGVVRREEGLIRPCVCVCILREVAEELAGRVSAVEEWGFSWAGVGRGRGWVRLGIVSSGLGGGGGGTERCVNSD